MNEMEEQNAALSVSLRLYHPSVSLSAVEGVLLASSTPSTALRLTSLVTQADTTYPPYDNFQSPLYFLFTN